MVSKNIRDFAESIREGDVEKAEELIGEISGEISSEVGKLSGVSSDLAEDVQKLGYNTVGQLARAPIAELVEIPELKQGKAKDILDSARKYLGKDLTELPGVGKETAEELVIHGYSSVADVARASVGSLTEVPGVGKRGAEKILKYAESESETELKDLPGVGEETAEKMREQGYTALGYIAKSSVEEILKIPNVGEKGAVEILEYAKQNPAGTIDDLPGVGEETAEEIRGCGYTPIRCVAESSVEELSEVPGIGKKGAKKILEDAREKVGKRVDELPGVDEGTVKELEKHGYSYIKDLAGSSVGELVTVPGLEEGRAKEVSESAEEFFQEESGDVQGYIHALEGVVSSLKSERDLALPCKIAEGNYTEEELKKRKREMEERTSQVFRPSEESSFYEAWTDVLTALIEIEKSSE